MNVKNLSIRDNAYPSKLRDIPSPPKELFYLGADPSECGWRGPKSPSSAAAASAPTGSK
ncbi:MAG: hypothetical protein WDN27_07155 [Candidatus Saccharibacteria bacterium]